MVTIIVQVYCIHCSELLVIDDSKPVRDGVLEMKLHHTDSIILQAPALIKLNSLLHGGLQIKGKSVHEYKL